MTGTYSREGGRVKECSDVPTTMIVFTSLPNFMPLCHYSKTLAHCKKTVFSQDVLNVPACYCLLLLIFD